MFTLVQYGWVFVLEPRQFMQLIRYDCMSYVCGVEVLIPTVQVTTIQRMYCLLRVVLIILTGTALKLNKILLCRLGRECLHSQEYFTLPFESLKKLGRSEKSTAGRKQTKKYQERDQGVIINKCKTFWTESGRHPVVITILGLMEPLL